MTIKQNLQKKLSKHKGSWVDKLSLVLWSYRTSFQMTIRETHFSLCYGVHAVVSVELTMPTFQIENFDEALNNKFLAFLSGLLEEDEIVPKSKQPRSNKLILGSIIQNSSCTILSKESLSFAEYSSTRKSPSHVCLIQTRKDPV